MGLMQRVCFLAQYYFCLWNLGGMLYFEYIWHKSNRFIQISTILEILDKIKQYFFEIEL